MKLTCKDIMINDWVMYNPNVFIEDEYEPTHECYVDRIRSGEDIDLAIEDCYYPIPLTAEILEKNGFRWNDLPVFQFWEYEDLLRIDSNGHDYWISLGCNMQMDVSHVNKLQHVLRLFGLNDLDDNFKV